MSAKREDDLPDPSALSALPIFPLPNCVLLPGGLLPLHVFEPRYRELTRDCLADSKVMAIARLVPGHETNYFGRPPIYPYAGLGRIICSDELSDGRYHILLRGVGRVRVESELDAAHSYRRVRATLLEDRRTERPQIARERYLQLVSLCDRLASVLDEGGDQLRELVRSQPCEASCADVLTAALVTDPDDRQTLLESLDPADRLERAIAHVGRLLCELAPCSGQPN
ncbi:MAG TPA: LON peptidase substrate-binding domain-containing protein [Kofleriaceae bacterium]|nr:LON peptidase substrate-binding domain-containing protein [Kofleriaceae bacterium]